MEYLLKKTQILNFISVNGEEVAKEMGKLSCFKKIKLQTNVCLLK